MTRFLAGFRFLLIIPVIGCVILTAVMMLTGAVRIVSSVASVVLAGEFSGQGAKTMTVEVIMTIDTFLVGTVAYIVAVGLYKLFISESKIELPMRLKIHNLKDLEDTLCGVIVVVLAVTFLGQAIGASDATQLLYAGAGVALMIAALAFFIRQGKGSDPDK